MKQGDAFDYGKAAAGKNIHDAVNDPEFLEHLERDFRPGKNVDIYFTAWYRGYATISLELNQYFC